MQPPVGMCNADMEVQGIATAVDLPAGAAAEPQYLWLGQYPAGQLHHAHSQQAFCTE